MGCGISDPFEYEYEHEYRCTEYEYDRGREVLRIPGLKLGATVVLVLSIAVLVLVLDSIRQAISRSARRTPRNRSRADKHRVVCGVKVESGIGDLYEYEYEYEYRCTEYEYEHDPGCGKIQSSGRRIGQCWDAPRASDGRGRQNSRYILAGLRPANTRCLRQLCFTTDALPFGHQVTC